MKQGALKAWAAYAVAALLVTGLVLLVALMLAQPAADRAIATAAVLAYVLQLMAFGMLLLVREQAHLFLAGWLGGMLLRFGALAGCMFWVTRTTVLPRGPLLLGLVGFVFLLLLLEPVFLRWDLRRS